MKQPRPIVLIEDDFADTGTFQMALRVLNVDAPVYCFESPEEALSFLKATDTSPGLIICNSRLAAISGTDLRETLLKETRVLAPVILFAKAFNEAELNKAFELPVQGFFIKEPSFEKYLDQLDRILKYWSISVTPDGSRSWR